MTGTAELRWGDETPRVAHLSGEIDVANAAELFAAVRAGTNGAGVVDLSDVSFVDSSALNQLVQLHNDIELRVIAAAGTPPRRLLELTGLDQVFQIYGELDTALDGQ
jgi:anti-sigma B factor antagonist